jgi:type IV secretion system protein VirD4
MFWKRLSLGLLALLLGSWAGTQVLAYQAHDHPALGRPIMHVGRHSIYLPTDGWRWAWQWGWHQPQRFQGAALTMLAVTALLSLPLVRRSPGTSGAARWATKADLNNAGLCASSGMVFGVFNGRIIRHNGPEHVLVVAPTQSGKSTSIVIPTLLSWDASVLVHDPKGELYPLTAGWRQTFSRLIHLAPTSPTSGQYNPLDAIRLGTPQEIRDAQLIADMLVDPEGTAEVGGVAQHFRELAGDLHTGLILHGLYTGQATTLAALNRLLTTDQSIAALMKTLETTAHSTAGCHPAVLRAAKATADLADREKSAVLSTARRALRLWTDPLVARATARSDFALRDLRERPQPMSLYLTIPFGDQERLRPLSRLIVRQMLDYCTQHTHGWTHRLLGLIDEVPALKRMTILADGLDFLAGFGVNLCLITPSLNKLDALYGPRNTFSEGCRFRVVFAPNDDDVASKFSRMTGITEVAKHREMIARSPWHVLRERTTTSTETTREPLLSPTALMQLPPESALLLIGNGPPALLQKARYFQNREWLRRSTLPVQGARP